jgi:hypothetical protein
LAAAETPAPAPRRAGSCRSSRACGQQANGHHRGRASMSGLCPRRRRAGHRLHEPYRPGKRRGGVEAHAVADDGRLFGAAGFLELLGCDVVGRLSSALREPACRVERARASGQTGPGIRDCRAAWPSSRPSASGSGCPALPTPTARPLGRGPGPWQTGTAVWAQALRLQSGTAGRPVWPHELGGQAAGARRGGASASQRRRRGLAEVGHRRAASRR